MRVNPFWAVTLGLAGLGCGSAGAPPSATPPPEPVPVDPDPKSTPAPPTDTGSSTEPPTGSDEISASCEVGVNPLRATCAIEVDSPSGVVVTFAPVDGSRPPQVRQRLEPALEHEVTLYFMTAETDYTFTAARTDDRGATTGGFRTGPLPARYSRLTTTGTSSASMIGAVSPCRSPVAVIHDTTGDLLWIQNMVQGGNGSHQATSFTEDRTVASIVYQGATSILSEVDVEGNQRRWFVRGVDFEHNLHHDVYKKDGLLYALAHETIDLGAGRRVLLDGFYVFGASGVVAEWWLADHWLPSPSIVPQTNGQGYDLTHGNSIWVDDDGDVYLSFRHIHSLVKVGGLGAGFGAVEWVAAGGPTPWANDFDFIEIEGEREGFFRQHNLHRLPTGELAMFDNRTGNTPSRLLVFGLDPAAGTYEALEAYDLPLHCDFQGGAWFTGAGNPLATCAPTSTAFEFDRGRPGAGTEEAPTVWEARLDCIGDPQSWYVPRFVPLDW